MAEKLSPKLYLAGALAVFLMLALAACSGGSSTKKSPNVPGAPTSAKTSSSGGASGGGAVCGKIARADAQALLPATITSAADDVLGDCIFRTNGGAPLTIT
ncbi:MAG: hypothetical protein ACRDG3_00610, partial [Tepidiformaceae bacterium]